MSHNKISRRGFIAGSAAAAATAAVSPLVLSKTARAASGDEVLCTLLDVGECIGCEECVDACREQWQATVPDPVKPMPQPFPSRVPINDWSGRKAVKDRLTPYNFLYVEKLQVPHKGEDKELNVPRRCMHCINPPCTNLCPFGAGRLEKNGVVHIDPDVCMGGNKCNQVCPWHIPQRQSGMGIYLKLLPTLAGNGVMFKCHRCLSLVKKGETPRCIEVCPQGLQSIGPRSEILAKAEALAKKRAQADGADPAKWREYVYGLVENGGTNTIYVTPMPVKEVAAAIAKEHKVKKDDLLARMDQAIAKMKQAGNQEALVKAKQARKRAAMSNLGRPAMGPVDNSMASEENMASALVIAPIAGLAAGFIKLFGGKQTPGGPGAGKGGAK